MASLDRENIAIQARKHPLPSEASKIMQQMNIQKPENRDCVFNWRPGSLAPPPIELYFPPFVKFVRDLQLVTNQTSFTQDELSEASEVVSVALSYYSSEYERQKMLCDTALFESSWAHQWTWAHNAFPNLADTNIRPDVFRQCFAKKVLSGRRPIMVHPEIVEFKNEAGVGDSDAICQAERDYVSIYTSSSPKVPIPSC
jgi:hypothetical protein